MRQRLLHKGVSFHMNRSLMSQGKSTEANQKLPPPLLYTNRSKILDEREHNVRRAMILLKYVDIDEPEITCPTRTKMLIGFCETLLFREVCSYQTI